MLAIVIASSRLSLVYGVGWQEMRWGGLAAHIEFKNTRNHNDRLRPISILKHCELEGFGAIDKKSAAAALIVLDYPMAPAVFTDQEERRSSTRLRRGRFRMFHGTSP
jgi:hypothetical protein